MTNPNFKRPIARPRRLSGLPSNQGPAYPIPAPVIPAGMNYYHQKYIPRSTRPTGLGAIPQQLSEMAGGNPFQFGYNVGVLSGTFGNKIYQPEEIGALLDNQDLSYNTHSYAMGGPFNTYIAVEGYAVTSWPSASQFAEAIYQAIAGAGYPIDYGSIQFRFEPYTASVIPQPPPMAGTPYPNAGSTANTTTNTNIPAPPPGQCDFSKMSFTNWLACELGVTPSSAATIGVVGTLGAVLLIGLAMKR